MCASVSVMYDNTSGQIRMTVQNMTGPGLDDPLLTKVASITRATPRDLILAELDSPHNACRMGIIQQHPLLRGPANRFRCQDIEWGKRGHSGWWVGFPFPVRDQRTRGCDERFRSRLEAGEVGLSIHAQSGPGGTSSTCLTLGSNANCDSSTVPEPGTVILLGTGLAGLAFVGRRRRKFLEED